MIVIDALSKVKEALVRSSSGRASGSNAKLPTGQRKAALEARRVIMPQEPVRVGVSCVLLVTLELPQAQGGRRRSDALLDLQYSGAAWGDGVSREENQ